jgi:hypothetical protein
MTKGLTFVGIRQDYDYKSEVYKNKKSAGSPKLPAFFHLARRVCCSVRESF